MGNSANDSSFSVRCPLSFANETRVFNLHGLSVYAQISNHGLSRGYPLTTRRRCFCSFLSYFEKFPTQDQDFHGESGMSLICTASLPRNCQVLIFTTSLPRNHLTDYVAIMQRMILSPALSSNGLPI